MSHHNYAPVQTKSSREAGRVRSGEPNFQPAPETPEVKRSTVANCSTVANRPTVRISPDEVMLLRALKKSFIIVALLRRLGGSASARDLADILEIDYSTMRKRLKELSCLGLVRRQNRYRYALTQSAAYILTEIRSIPAEASPIQMCAGFESAEPSAEPVPECAGDLCPEAEMDFENLPTNEQPSLGNGSAVFSRRELRESVKLSKTDKHHVNSLTDSLDSLGLDSPNSDSPEEEPELLETLQALGIYRKTALELLGSHDDDEVRAHIAYFRHAFTKGLARTPGWLVLSLRKSWPAPPGFASYEAEWHNPRRYTSGLYAKYVNH